MDRTFLFTDIEGSTTLWEHFPERMRSALARHDSILREVKPGLDVSPGSVARPPKTAVLRFSTCECHSARSGGNPEQTGANGDSGGAVCLGH